MKFVIRKVPERNTLYLERLLPKDQTIIVSDIEHRGPLWSMNKAFSDANDDAIYIQDDMLLCPRFVERTQEYIEKYQDDVIVFANNTAEGNPMVDHEGFYGIRTIKWLMCTYVPDKIAKAYLYELKMGIWKPSEHDVKYRLDDNVFTKWMASKDMLGFLTVPNLAGHPQNKSTINGWKHPEVCTNFDYAHAEKRLVGEEQ